ncbi:hypothetical protein BC827DRAFT_654501 [Russula dissimulans]|nr:hypothetical protein BC827DRAFT_654501 [Russula dissimulans]
MRCAISFFFLQWPLAARKFSSHHFAHSRNHDEDDGLAPSMTHVAAEFQIEGGRKGDWRVSRTAHHGTHFENSVIGDRRLDATSTETGA